MDPHHQGIFVAVVALAYPDRRQAEAAVQGLRRLVRHPDLEGQMPGPEGEGFVDEPQHQPGTDTPAPVGFRHGDGRYVRLVDDPQ